MLFAEYQRCQYARPPLVEVICQLRFPTILSIGVKEPVTFQEAVRHDFPRYQVRQEQPAPMRSGPGGPDPQPAPPPTVTNYSFVSMDGAWKLNLTNSFIALSTLRYTRWEDFALRLDKPLAQFIQIYQPAFFERIGLRYVNAVSRTALSLQDQLWDDLIRSQYLGVLGEADVEETTVSKCSTDVELSLSGGCRAKIHAGPGLLGGGKTDREIKFILDGDFSAAGSLTTDSMPAKLEELHVWAVRFFQGAITPGLDAAMGPVLL